MTSQSLDNGVNYRVSLDLRESDNYREHNESSYLNGFGKLGYEHDSGSVFAELQYIDDQLNTPGTLFDNEVAADRRQVSANFANDFSDAITRVARVGMVQSVSENWSFEAELTSRDLEGVFRLVRCSVPRPGIVRRTGRSMSSRRVLSALSRRSITPC